MISPVLPHTGKHLVLCDVHQSQLHFWEVISFLSGSKYHQLFSFIISCLPSRMSFPEKQHWLDSGWTNSWFISVTRRKWPCVKPTRPGKICKRVRVQHWKLGMFLIQTINVGITNFHITAVYIWLVGLKIRLENAGPEKCSSFGRRSKKNILVSNSLRNSNIHFVFPVMSSVWDSNFKALLRCRNTICLFLGWIMSAKGQKAEGWRRERGEFSCSYTG